VKVRDGLPCHLHAERSTTAVPDQQGFGVVQAQHDVSAGATGPAARLQQRAARPQQHALGEERRRRGIGRPGRGDSIPIAPVIGSAAGLRPHAGQGPPSSRPRSLRAGVDDRDDAR
jgi:hypothetical protein